MPQFREFLKAEDVANGAAVLMNDPEMTDYTVVKQIPVMNMAIAELNEHLIESNIPITNEISQPAVIQAGENYITNLPLYLVEIQEVGERQFGEVTSFKSLPRREFPTIYPAQGSLLFWCWQNQRVIFNPNGAIVKMEVQVKYIQTALKAADDANSIIGTTNAQAFLTFKTAALLSMFIGENQTRAAVLNEEADKSLERIVGISNKGKQQIMTRHRPFRAGFKMRGW